MAERYFIDTSIWMDFYEDRAGFKGEPLGDYAFKLLSKIKAKESRQMKQLEFHLKEKFQKEMLCMLL